MAEELQALLDRIQSDGVERAEQDAGKIIADAKAQAKSLLADAEKKAEAILQKAEEEGALFQQRSENAVSQAARDVLLSVGEAVNDIFRSLIAADVENALASDRFPELIETAIRAYCKNEKATELTVLLNEEQQEAVSAYFKKKVADAIDSGLTLGGRRGIISGFRVVKTNSGVEHDFTGEALTRAFSELLRPQLAEIVSTAMNNKGKATA